VKKNQQLSEEDERLMQFAKLGAKVFTFVGLAFLALSQIPAISRFLNNTVNQLSAKIPKQLKEADDVEDDQTLGQ
jgi:hypothetical protein